MEQVTLVEAMRQIPCGLFVMGAAHDGRRSGVLAQWVQQCSVEPRLVVLALPKGMPIEPLIRDSRWFTLCQIGADDRFLHRKFAVPHERGDDPFVAIETEEAPSGAPIIGRALSWLDCELVRHVDLESDHRLYVGQAHHGGMLNAAPPAVVFGGLGAA